MIGVKLLISGLVFSSVVLASLGVYFYWVYFAERRKVLRRVEGVEGKPASEAILWLAALKQRLLGLFGALGTLTKPKKEEEISHLRKAFMKAGYRREGTIVLYFGIKVLLAALFPFLFFLVKLLVVRVIPPMTVLAGAVLLALIGFYLPNLWLLIVTSRRQEMIQKGLPDALDLMVVCAEAGIGLDGAINRVGEEMKLGNRPLSDEFQLMSLELRAGKPRREALRNLAVRTDLDDIKSLSTLLIQTERFGTSIAQALRVHSDAMRTKRFQRAEEVAAKLPVKLLFPLILFIFPSLFVAILGPAVIQIYRTLLPTLGGR
jgi:tight adherence protein C